MEIIATISQLCTGMLIEIIENNYHWNKYSHVNWNDREQLSVEWVKDRSANCNEENYHQWNRLLYSQVPKRSKGVII